MGRGKRWVRGQNQAERQAKGKVGKRVNERRKVSLNRDRCNFLSVSVLIQLGEGKPKGRDRAYKYSMASNTR